MNTKPKFDRRFLLVIPACILAIYLPVVIKDAMLYSSVAHESGCCGFVSESWLERPVTYALVDEWTVPVWGENAEKSQRWLTSDGKVNGQTKFWRILERQPNENAQP